MKFALLNAQGDRVLTGAGIPVAWLIHQVTVLLKDYLLRHLTIKDVISASAADAADEYFSLACE